MSGRAENSLKMGPPGGHGDKASEGDSQEVNTTVSRGELCGQIRGGWKCGEGSRELCS